MLYTGNWVNTKISTLFFALLKRVKNKYTKIQDLFRRHVKKQDGLGRSSRLHWTFDSLKKLLDEDSVVVIPRVSWAG